MTPRISTTPGKLEILGMVVVVESWGIDDRFDVLSVYGSVDSTVVVGGKAVATATIPASDRIV